MLPFTPAQFFDVFRLYNEAIWPAQLAGYALGLIAVGALFRSGPVIDRLAAIALALMWIWTGFVYHWLYFYPINPAALLFGSLFIAQGLLFLTIGASGPGLTFQFAYAPRPLLGMALIAYAAIAYPLIGLAAGHSYSQLPQFGVTPCPVVLLTFGRLLLLRSAVRWWMVAIPLLWSLIGGTAAFLLDVPQDWVLLASGPLTVFLMVKRKPRLLCS